MILLYTTLVALLVVTRWLVRRRVATLEKRYARAAAEADKVLKAPHKQGANGKPDPVAEAKRQYLLGQLAQKRDAVEARYASWQARSERLNRWVAAVRGWQGRKLPYTLGVLDVVGLLALVDALGVGEHVSARALVNLGLSLLGRG